MGCGRGNARVELTEREVETGPAELVHKGHPGVRGVVRDQSQSQAAVTDLPDKLDGPIDRLTAFVRHQRTFHIQQEPVYVHVESSLD